MAYNYIRSQAVADKMITKYGMRAVLRRDSLPDRDCIVTETQYTPAERAGKLINPTDRIFLMNARNLALPPLQGTDTLVTFVQPEGIVEDEVLKLTQKPGRLAPAGIVVYWEVVVRG